MMLRAWICPDRQDIVPESGWEIVCMARNRGYVLSVGTATGAPRHRARSACGGLVDVVGEGCYGWGGGGGGVAD